MQQEINETKAKTRLPLRAGSKYYEIRLESIGGLGANLCGKMLGELGVKHLDLNSVSFSSYGSEKTGTPVKGYIRYCAKETEIRVHSPVIHPDLLVIFHQALMQDEKVWEGCDENTEVILALEEGRERAAVPVRVKACYGVRAQKIAMETRSRINVVMLGAMAKVMGFVPLSDINKVCEAALGKKYPDALKGNLEGIRRGYEEVEETAGIGMKGSPGTDGREKTGGKADRKSAHCPAKSVSPAMPEGGINPRFGSTVVADLSPSRQGYIPVFIKERCINCGFCDSACPDMVFQFAKGEYNGREMMVNKGLDYYHCKGCLRCVDVCPVNALVKGLEAEHPDKKYFLPNQDLLRKPDYYIEAGPDGYITSESYLTEKRMEGGEV